MNRILRFQKYLLTRELFAESLGTFLLVLIGISANIQSSQHPSDLSNPIAWGLGFMFAVLITNGSSESHLNPAIYLKWVLGNLPTWKLAPYIFSQIIGAFIGALVAYLGHFDDLQEIIKFTDQPPSLLFITSSKSFITEIIGSGVLSACVCVITDKKHKIRNHLVPVLAGAIISMITMSWGACVINPARDLGPRLFCYLAKWEMLSAHHFFWIPILGPIIGAIIGAWTYKALEFISDLISLISKSKHK